MFLFVLFLDLFIVFLCLSCFSLLLPASLLLFAFPAFRRLCCFSLLLTASVLFLLSCACFRFSAPSPPDHSFFRGLTPFFGGVGRWVGGWVGQWRTMLMFWLTCATNVEVFVDMYNRCWCFAWPVWTMLMFWLTFLCLGLPSCDYTSYTSRSELLGSSMRRLSLRGLLSLC